MLQKIIVHAAHSGQSLLNVSGPWTAPNLNVFYKDRLKPFIAFFLLPTEVAKKTLDVELYTENPV